MAAKTLEIGHSRILCLCSMLGFQGAGPLFNCAGVFKGWLAPVPNFLDVPKSNAFGIRFSKSETARREESVAAMTGVQIATQDAGARARTAMTLCP
jgi:hypothetical protein